MMNASFSGSKESKKQKNVSSSLSTSHRQLTATQANHLDEDPTYKSIRAHNNTAIDSFYQNLMRQSDAFSTSSFRNDMINHRMRSHLQANRPHMEPVVVDQILPGQEGNYVHKFIQKLGSNQMPNGNGNYQHNVYSHQMAFGQTQTPQYSNTGIGANKGMMDAYTSASNQQINSPEQLIEKDNKPLEARNKLVATNPVVFFDIEVDDSPRGQIQMELFKHTHPRTAENFRQLCTGEKDFGFNQSYFHRIIPDFMCQGGDFQFSNGTGGYSIYGEYFDDENFAFKHDAPFLLSMANSGPNTNGSQFFITFTTCDHLDGKHVVFGQVLRGFDILKDIELCGTPGGDITREVKIASCGQLH